MNEVSITVWNGLTQANQVHSGAEAANFFLKSERISTVSKPTFSILDNPTTWCLSWSYFPACSFSLWGKEAHAGGTPLNPLLFWPSAERFFFSVFSSSYRALPLAFGSLPFWHGINEQFYPPTIWTAKTSYTWLHLHLVPLISPKLIMLVF